MLDLKPNLLLPKTQLSKIQLDLCPTVQDRRFIQIIPKLVLNSVGNKWFIGYQSSKAKQNKRRVETNNNKSSTTRNTMSRPDPQGHQSPDIKCGTIGRIYRNPPSLPLILRFVGLDQCPRCSSPRFRGIPCKHQAPRQHQKRVRL